MTPAGLIFNPRSGRQAGPRLLDRVRRQLESAGYDARPLATRGPGDAGVRAREAREAGAQAVFVMGGDGTLREAAIGLVGTEVPLGILPTGTVNVLALSLGLPRRTLAAASGVGNLRPRSLDVGFAADEPFLMMASGGLDAEIMALQNASWKRYLGRAAIGIGGVARFCTYTFPELRVQTNGHLESAGFFSVCNIPHYGGPFRMAPEADPADGQLDVVTLHSRGRVATAGFARDLALGRHLGRKDVSSWRSNQLQVDGPGPLLLQLDGDALRFQPPVTIGVRPSALQVLAPG